jgi:hypothetical protein
VSKRGLLVSALVVLATFGLACEPAERMPPPPLAGPPDLPGGWVNDPAGRERVFVSSELFAGFLVALDAHRNYMREQGVELTPLELTRSQGKIGCQWDEVGMIDVTFYPERITVGGSVRYIVDPKELKIVRVIFGR